MWHNRWTMNTLHKTLEAPGLWLEGAAIAQLQVASRLPGMAFAFGLPDLHPGRGMPVGAAFLGEQLYPHLVGSDIGCGVAVWKANAKGKRPATEKWAKKLKLDAPLGIEDAMEALAKRGLDGSDWSWHFRGFGTIGRGNHFAELGVCEKPQEGSPLQEGDLVLLVHSGSRSFGESVGSAHWEARGARSLEPETEAGQAWLRAQPVALAFAEENRAAIARRFLDQIGLEGEFVLDVCHNYAEEILVSTEDLSPLRAFAEQAPGGFDASALPGLLASEAGGSAWMTRKGAASSQRGLVAIAGSRGTPSFIFEPSARAPLLASGWSLAHGAGRKWARADCKDRLSHRFNPEQLRRPAPGSFVVCDDKDLLFEEAPQAYKDIEPVIAALEAAGAGRAVCQTRPILSYKTREDACC